MTHTMVVASCSVAEWAEHHGVRVPMYYEVTMEATRQPAATFTFFTGQPPEIGTLHLLETDEFSPQP